MAGEPCPKRTFLSTYMPDSCITSYSLADDWSQRVEFYNCCGPTEVTIVNTIHRHKQGAEITIGKPVPNTKVYILAENEEPVPVGATGFMWVGGAGVSRGYLNLPELTAMRYKYDKFSNDGLLSPPLPIEYLRLMLQIRSQMFNTGDLCRWRPDGSITHQGRADEQVKIKVQIPLDPCK